VIDSQSVKADAVVGSDSRGFDGGKLVNGRKRHVVVDTLGLLLAVMVTAADTDRPHRRPRPAAAPRRHPPPAGPHLADGGYTGSLVEYCLATLALVLAIVKRNDDRADDRSRGSERRRDRRPPPTPVEVGLFGNGVEKKLCPKC
jgi:transposase